jgi:hypothetical protein
MNREFKCNECGYYVIISGNSQQWLEYDEGEILIQNIFPEISAEDREIMLSGICGDCFDKIFS